MVKFKKETGCFIQRLFRKYYFYISYFSPFQSRKNIFTINRVSFLILLCLHSYYLYNKRCLSFLKSFYASKVFFYIKTFFILFSFYGNFASKEGTLMFPFKHIPRCLAYLENKFFCESH